MIPCIFFIFFKEISKAQIVSITNLLWLKEAPSLFSFPFYHGLWTQWLNPKFKFQSPIPNKYLGFGYKRLVHDFFIRYFGTLIWDDITIIYLLFSFCRVKKKERIAVEFFLIKSLNLFSLEFASKKIHKKTEKNHNKFSSQNIVISSQNNIPKYCTEGHEQVFRLCFFVEIMVD
jgi:hypothetical protein